MNVRLFILKEETFMFGLFPTIPDFRKKGSWYLFTDGRKDDLLVTDKTTVKQIRQGKYQKLTEISKDPFTAEHKFHASCKEPSYQFDVHVRVAAAVQDPVRFYENLRMIHVKEYLNNRFQLEVGRIARKYSILNYNGIEEELTEALVGKPVYDLNSVLRYQIKSVFVEPDAQAKKILQEVDEMRIRKATDSIAYDIMKDSEYKSYKDAVLEEVARGIITRSDGIVKIEEYQKNGYQDKIKALLQLREEGFLTDADVMNQIPYLLPSFEKGTAQQGEKLCGNKKVWEDDEDMYE